MISVFSVLLKYAYAYNDKICLKKYEKCNVTCDYSRFSRDCCKDRKEIDLHKLTRSDSSLASFIVL